jgi:hypothetical protein
MRPHSKRLTHGALLLGAAACAASPKADEVDIDFEFECGELDFYDLMSLVGENRLYEVACGAMPEGYPDLDLDWRELAAEYRNRGRRECRGDPMDNDFWRTAVRTGCAKEAAVSLGIRAYRAASCPTYELVESTSSTGPQLNRTPPYYIGRPYNLSVVLDRSLYSACYPDPEEPQE